MACGLYYEKKFRGRGCNLVIGVDEVGRGCLAGPVVAAAVLLNKPHFKNRIDDSKKLTPSQRDKAYPEIIGNSVFGIGIKDEKVIDRINILEATRMAMEQALARLFNKLRFPADEARIHILVDGNVKLDIRFPFTNIIRGDSRSRSIACASIVAKVIRDRMMASYDKTYPQYGFIRHKGYPTKMHKTAINRFGLSIIHRNSFRYA